MKKKLIAAFVFLFVLTAAYIVVINMPEKAAENKTVETEPLFHDFELCRIDVENEVGKYSILSEGGLWKIGDNEADGALIAAALSMSGIIMPDDIDRLACGLEPARATVTLTDKKGVGRTLYIGDTAPDNSGTYVMTDRVYITKSDIAESFTVGEENWLKKQAFTVGYNLTSAEINDMRFEKINDIWYMTKPYRIEAKSAELKRLLLDMPELTIESFSNKTTAECGLDKPKMYITTENEIGEANTIYFGNRENGLIYAMQDGRICLVKPPEILEKTAVSLISSLCYIKNIDDVFEIDVNGVKFTVSNGVYTKDGKNVPKEQFTEFYKKLMGMTLIGEAVSPQRDKQLLNISVFFKDNTVDKVEVFEYKDRYASVFVNGECSFFISKENVEDILSAIQTL